LGYIQAQFNKNLVKNYECWTNPHNLTECNKALSQKVKHCTDIGAVIHKLTSAITAACDASFQVLRPGKGASKERSVPWWNEELTTLREKAIAMRQRYHRTTNDADLRQERRLRYQESNRTYQAKLREAKLISWRDFCSGTELQPLEFGIPIRGWENTRHAHPVNTQSKQ
jgi:hypothetical protein